MSRKTHALKSDPDPFQATIEGRKTYELRLDDRGFEKGDLLHLRETQYSGDEMKAGKPLVYTGRNFVGEVTHILRGPAYGLMEGWVILSMSRPLPTPEN